MNPTELINTDSQQLFLPQVRSIEPDGATQKILEVEQLLIDALTAFQGLRSSFVDRAKIDLELTTARELTVSQQQQIDRLETKLIAQQDLYVERSRYFQQLFQNFETIVRSLKGQIDKLQSAGENHSTTAIVDRQLALVTQADRQIEDINRYFAAAGDAIDLSVDFKQLPSELSTLNHHLEEVAREIDRQSIQVRGFANRTSHAKRQNPTANLEIKSERDRAPIALLSIDLPRF